MKIKRWTKLNEISTQRKSCYRHQKISDWCEDQKMNKAKRNIDSEKELLSPSEDLELSPSSVSIGVVAFSFFQWTVFCSFHLRIRCVCKCPCNNGCVVMLLNNVLDDHWEHLFDIFNLVRAFRLEASFVPLCVFHVLRRVVRLLLMSKLFSCIWYSWSVTLFPFNLRQFH